MALLAANGKQIAEKSILDTFNRQTYLGSHYIYSTTNTSIVGTAETPFISLSNPSTSTVALFSDVRKLMAQSTATTSVDAEILWYEL